MLSGKYRYVSICCAQCSGSTGPVPSPSDAADLTEWHPDLAQARRGAEYVGTQGRAPEKCHAAAPPAVPALHVRSYKSAGWTGPRLTTLRSWQFTTLN